MDTEWMTPEQVAEYLQIDTDEVVQLARTRAIPAAEVAGSYRFERSEVDKWMRQGGQAGARAAEARQRVWAYLLEMQVADVDDIAEGAGVGAEDAGEALRELNAATSVFREAVVSAAIHGPENDYSRAGLSLALDGSLPTMPRGRVAWVEEATIGSQAVWQQKQFPSTAPAAVWRCLGDGRARTVAQVAEQAATSRDSAEAVLGALRTHTWSNHAEARRAWLHIVETGETLMDVATLREIGADDIDPADVVVEVQDASGERLWRRESIPVDREADTGPE